MVLKDANDLTIFLSKNILMSLATIDKEMWSASVYYLFDKDFNFYFLSPTDSLHCLNIEKNQKVSLTIADNHQKASDKKVGFQMRGTAEKVKSINEIKNVIAMWNGRKFGTPPITYKLMMKVWKSRFYKITPSYMKFFNEKLYGEEGIRDWKFEK